MEPNTPKATLKRGDREIPLAWTMRSEAIASKYGFTWWQLFEALTNRSTFMYALCVGLKATLPAALGGDEPEDYASWFEQESAQVDAGRHLVTLLLHAHPLPEEKKSAATPSSTGPAPSSTAASGPPSSIGGSSGPSNPKPSPALPAVTAPRRKKR